jgi:hypothetical protein
MRFGPASRATLEVALAALGAWIIVGCPPQPPIILPDAADSAIAVLDANAPSPAPTIPPPIPPPSPDAAPAPPPDASCASACASLTAAGCSLSGQGDCSTFLTRDLGSGKVPNPATGRPLTCADVAAVRTQADAQRLGFSCR